MRLSDGMKISLRRSKILVTGFPGFISLHLIRKIQKEKGRVFAIKEPSSILSPLARQLVKNGLKVFDADIGNFKSVQRIIAKVRPTIIFHLAAYTNAERNADVFDQCLKTNIQGTLNLLLALEEIPYKSFINISSVEAYGIASQPVSPYGISKLAAENICNFFHKIYHRPTVNLRLPMVYGEYQPVHKIIPSLVLPLLKQRTIKMTSGEQTRDFIYVEDAVEAFIKAVENKRAFGETIGIGSGREISIKKLALKILEYTGSSSKIRFGALPTKQGEIMRARVSVRKAGKILGWKPKTSLKTGLKKVIKQLSSP